MTEDPRISEIRAALAAKDADKIPWWTTLDRIRAILDRPACECQPFDFCEKCWGPEQQREAAIRQLAYCEEAVPSGPEDADQCTNLREPGSTRCTDHRLVSDSEPSAPRVFLPGDTLPRGAAAINEDGDLVAGAYRLWGMDGPLVELPTPSPEEWRAAVDRARDARADAMWAYTEGTNP